MTDDTKQALAILAPICDLLHVEIDADEKVMVMNGQKIGIACNSTYATVMEGIGYLFAEKYAGKFRRHVMGAYTLEAIKRYWVKGKQSEGSEE